MGHKTHTNILVILASIVYVELQNGAAILIYFKTYITYENKYTRHILSPV